MVNFQDPAVIVRDFWALSKISHTFDGLYIWEFITTLDYEWHVIRGRVHYRWSIWVGIGGPFGGANVFFHKTTLMAVVMDLVTLNIANPINCQVVVILSFTFGFSAFILSSLLIILRVIAIWDRNKIVVGLATILWVTNVSLMIHNIVRIHSEWIPVQDVCNVPNKRSFRETFVFMFITDSVLLVTMLIGLFRLRVPGAGTRGLQPLLWKQGLIWLFIATAVELPPVVFIFLGLNDAFDRMFLMPSLISISIAATRMHRSLMDFGSSSQIVMHSEPPRRPRISHTNSKTRSTSTVATPPQQVEVSVHLAYEDGPTSLTDENVSTNLPEQLQRDRPDGKRFDIDAESGV